MFFLCRYFRRLRANYVQERYYQYFLEDANSVPTCYIEPIYEEAVSNDSNIIIESKDSVVPRTVVTALPKMLKELSANEDFDLSISLGVCLWEKGMNRKAFVERADERMYALKRSYHKQGIK